MNSKGERVDSFSTLRKVMEQDFDLVYSEDFPMIIKETARKHQWTATHATVWRKRV